MKFRESFLENHLKNYREHITAKIPSQESDVWNEIVDIDNSLYSAIEFYSNDTKYDHIIKEIVLYLNGIANFIGKKIISLHICESCGSIEKKSGPVIFEIKDNKLKCNCTSIRKSCDLCEDIYERINKLF